MRTSTLALLGASCAASAACSSEREWASSAAARPALAAGTPVSDAASGPAPAAVSAPAPAPAPALQTPVPARTAPAEYLRLHNLATDPRQAAWPDALRELADVSDGYTLERLGTLDRMSLTVGQVVALDATIASINARLPAADVPPSAAEIEARLERAGWADLTCDRCEMTLVPWATKSIAEFADDPAVRATLERVRDTYEPAADLQLDSRWGLLSDRVRGYAAKILKGQVQQAAKTTP